MTAVERIVLPITPGYVPTWGPWEVVRELLQNAKDEEEQHAHPMTVDYRDGQLVVVNLGADLNRSALLLGATSKADRPDLRGKFGEGLDLALLAAARGALPLVLTTQTERWVPRLEPVEQYGGAVCLVIEIEALPARAAGVQVTLRLAEEEWQALRHLCRFLGDQDAEQVKTSKGTILLDPRRKAHVYAKGVFVQRFEGLQFGYDLLDCPLDRDRRMVNAWDFQWLVAQMYTEACEADPVLMVPQLYRLMRDDNEDVRGICYHADSKVAGQIAQAFQAEHGANAMPAGSIAESAKLDQAGKRGVIVPQSLAQLLQKALGTTEDVTKQLSSAVVRTYGWEELSEVQRGVLEWAAGAVTRAAISVGLDRRPMLERTVVVDFRDQSLQGTTDGERIRVPHRLLVNRLQLLATLLHEEAHAVGGDGTRAHVDMLERLWIAVYREATEGT